MTMTAGIPVVWGKLSSTFPRDTAQLVEALVPNLMVNLPALRNVPTRGDPLGRKPRLELNWDMAADATYLRVVVDGVCSPSLAGEAFQAYVCVEWPELFRMR